MFARRGIVTAGPGGGAGTWQRPTPAGKLAAPIVQVFPPQHWALAVQAQPVGAHIGVAFGSKSTTTFAVPTGRICRVTMFRPGTSVTLSGPPSQEATESAVTAAHASLWAVAVNTTTPTGSDHRQIVGPPAITSKLRVVATLVDAVTEIQRTFGGVSASASVTSAICSRAGSGPSAQFCCEQAAAAIRTEDIPRTRENDRVRMVSPRERRTARIFHSPSAGCRESIVDRPDRAAVSADCAWP